MGAGLPFEWIVDCARMGVTVATPVTDATGRVVDFRYEYVNERGADIIGASRDDIVGRTMTELKVARTGGLRERYVAAFERREPFSQTIQVIDGAATGWYDLLVGRTEDHLVVAFDDVTEQVETRERERLASERMVAAFRRVPGAVYSFDRDLRFTFLDADAERMFGGTAEDVLGRPLDEVHRGLAPEYEAMLRQAMELGEPVAFDLDLTWPRKGLFSVRAYPDSEGLTVYVTELEPVLRLERRAAHLERLEAIATLTGGIAHDFNNLVMVIGGHASMLAAELGSDPELAEDVEAIVDASRRAAELTAQLLRFSRQQVVQPVTVDLDALVAERAVDWRATAPPGVLVETVPAGDPLLVRVDPGELGRVLDHVVQNAFEAMGERGRLVVETSRFVDDADIAAGAVPGVVPGSFGVVTLTDDGEGMDAETLARAPEPFFTTRSRAGSSGLGLSVAHGAVRQAGGRLAIYSEAGVGTTVRLYVPEAIPGDPVVGDPGPQTAVAGRDAGSAAAAPRAGGERILVVDDHASVRALTTRILVDLGYEVVAAADAEQALEVIGSAGVPIDLMVVDVVMPGRSGFELAEAVREIRPALPVLYVSGFTERGVHPSGVETDGDHFLSKPFAAADLGVRVRRLLDAAR